MTSPKSKKIFQAVVVTALALLSCGGGASAQTLRVGAEVVVKNTYEPGKGFIGLKLRNGSGLKAPQTGNLPEGTQVKIIGGPVSKDGHTWWNVESPMGKGWCSGNWLVQAPSSAIPPKTPPPAVPPAPVQAPPPVPNIQSPSPTPSFPPTGKQAGQVIGSYKGVEAYSNGEKTKTEYGPLEYQCLPYVQRFYQTHYPWVKTIYQPGGWGTARNFWNEPHPQLQKLANNGQSKPKPDDILFFDYGNSGHVAIVMNVNVIGDSVQVIEQNMNRDTAYRSVSLSDPKIIGWLRSLAPVQVPPQGVQRPATPTPPSPSVAYPTPQPPSPMLPPGPTYDLQGKGGTTSPSATYPHAQPPSPIPTPGLTGNLLGTAGTTPPTILPGTTYELLRVGMNAMVVNTYEQGKGYVGLNLRSAPNLNSSKVGNLPEGTRVKITGGPHPWDGLTWWNVESPIGKGWCSGNWLAPVP